MSRSYEEAFAAAAVREAIRERDEARAVVEAVIAALEVPGYTNRDRLALVRTAVWGER